MNMLQEEQNKSMLSKTETLKIKKQKSITKKIKNKYYNDKENIIKTTKNGLMRDIKKIQPRAQGRTTTIS